MMHLYTKNYQTFKIETAEGDIIKEFAGATEAGKALPGDVVEPTETGCKLVGRVIHPPLAGLLEMDTKVRYGFTSRGVPLYMFKPYNEAYPPLLVATKETVRENQLAVVMFEHWDEGTFPRGGIINILGAAGIKEVEKAAVALQYSPWAWSKKTVPELLIMPQKEGRFVLDKPTINIDPLGCRDIDDVISLWEENDVWNLAISISDVAAFVALNPALEFAEKIGQTLYTSTGKVIRSMFPGKYSENLFSLLPGEERFVVSLFAKWDGTSLYGFQWKECILRNWASYTYDDCRDATEINMEVLREIVRSLESDTRDTHKWIEAFMLLYNSEAAAILKKSGAGLLRTHGEPEKELLAHMEMLGLPAKQLAYPAAVYATADTTSGHWGLRKATYCHASSPIRRYADVLNQTVLKASIRESKMTGDIPYKKYALALNRVDKSVKAYERDCRFVDCILDKPGIPVDGLVVESANGKIAIYCFEWKCMIRVKRPAALSPGDQVVLGFYVNTTRASWKKRIVYRIELTKSANTDSQESQYPLPASPVVHRVSLEHPHSE
jgi:exoribonuclease R